MDFEDDIKKLIDLIWTKNTDDEVIETVILFFQNEEINNGYKVDLLMKIADIMNSDYYAIKRDEFDKKYNS